MPVRPGSVPGSLPGSLIERYRRFQKRRRLVRESRYYLREVGRILRWQWNRARVTAEAREQIRVAAGSLREALAVRPFDEGKTREALESLERLVDAHLAFGRKSTLREYTEAIGLAALVAVLLRFFVIQPFKIPSGSMISTLEVGDHIFVNKFSYGLMVPFTTKPPKRFVNWGWPKRGEVVVFIHKRKPEQDFIKRVVAIGGDRIKVVNEEIHLQRGGKGTWQKVPRSLQAGDCSHMDKNERDNTWYRVDGCSRYTETLDGKKYTTVYVPTQFGQMRDYPPVADFRRTPVPVGFGLEPADEVVDPYHVPRDSVFVMGDNRRNSTDSRDLAEVGFIPESYIKGRALVVWWSWGPESFRWARVGKLVR